jgi:hypothetical protein
VPTGTLRRGRPHRRLGWCAAPRICISLETPDRRLLRKVTGLELEASGHVLLDKVPASARRSAYAHPSARNPRATEPIFSEERRRQPAPQVVSGYQCASRWCLLCQQRPKTDTSGTTRATSRAVSHAFSFLRARLTSCCESSSCAGTDTTSSVAAADATACFRARKGARRRMLSHGAASGPDLRSDRSPGRGRCRFR